MKMFNRKTIVLITAAIILTMSAIGCSQDPIFAAIESEVKLKDPSVQGSILSLVTHNNNVYTANGYLYCRTDGVGDWNKMDLPAGVHRCTQVAVTSNSGTGEMFGFFQNSSWGFHSVQRYTDSGWERLTQATKGSAIKNGNGFIYFFRIDDATNNEGATTIYSVHRIDPDGTMTEILGNLEFSSKKGERPIDADGDYFITNKSVYNADGTLISTGTDAPSYGLAGIAVNGTNVYATTGSYVYHYNGSAWTQFTHGATGPAYGLTYLGAGDKNLLLIPCAEGYGEVLLNDSGQPEKAQVPGKSETSSISPNSQSQYSSSMDEWNVLSIFVVANQVPAGNDYCLYASILDPADGGLWGYYSNTRKEWNRE